MAEQHRGELILAAIGPETNIAMVIKRKPRLRQWVREITVMGGSTTTGNYTPAAEFNIASDVEATWTVFESGIPIRMIGHARHDRVRRAPPEGEHRAEPAQPQRPQRAGGGGGAQPRLIDRVIDTILDYA